MDDREVVLAIKAGDQAGLAAAYDRYATNLYGYCYWLLREPAAADALQKTFIFAATHLGDLDDPSQLRSWLYRSARDECHGRMRTRGRGAGEPAEYPADGTHAAQRAELRKLIQATLATLKKDEGEVIELSVRHGLDETEIAAVLVISWSQAHALLTHARTHLERTLGALLIARTGRKACLVLDALLADWDGQLTVQTGQLVSQHVDECEICARQAHGGLRPEMLAGLLPHPTLPAGMREQILQGLSTPSDEPTLRLKPVTATTEVAGLLPHPTLPAGTREQIPQGLSTPSDEPTLRLKPVTATTEVAAFSPATKPGLWTKVRRNPGAATAAAAVLMWAAAAITATLITVTGLHAVPALAAQSHGTPSISPAPAATSGTPATTRPQSSRSPVPTQPPERSLPPAVTSPSPPSPSPSAKSSTSPSATATSSASAVPSASPTPTPTHSRSPSPTPSPTPTPSGTPSASAT